MENKKAINNSILSDDDKMVKLVYSLLRERKSIAMEYIPISFYDIPMDILELIKKIDKAFQIGLISYDEAIELIANLFEREGIRRKFGENCSDLLLSKQKELYELYETRFQDLLTMLSSGRITQEEFFQELAKLNNWLEENMTSLLEHGEMLDGFSR